METDAELEEIRRKKFESTLAQSDKGAVQAKKQFGLKVKIYSTPTCPYCVQAKRYFDLQGIAYVEVNVASDQKAAYEMAQIEINGRTIVGFDRPALDAIIASFQMMGF
ncbi:hypothetical protein FJZ26_04655 [Candidatus Parvarchaeota archaeon]|nr:hypothetical protein [Candidatus Parvarchaeota archaeon]